jgi:hypothetical protein
VTGRNLLVAVGLDMMLDRVFGVLDGVQVMAVREVRVVGGFLVVAGLVVRGGFVVMARSVFVMLGCLFVMMSCFVGHRTTSIRLKKQGCLSPDGLSAGGLTVGVNGKLIQDEYPHAEGSGEFSRRAWTAIADVRLSAGCTGVLPKCAGRA